MGEVKAEVFKSKVLLMVHSLPPVCNLFVFLWGGGEQVLILSVPAPTSVILPKVRMMLLAPSHPPPSHSLLVYATCPSRLQNHSKSACKIGEPAVVPQTAPKSKMVVLGTHSRTGYWKTLEDSSHW